MSKGPSIEAAPRQSTSKAAEAGVVAPGGGVVVETPAPHSRSTPPAGPEGLVTREYRIPFGRYEGSDRAPPPAHQSMIGRFQQRARLLNLLFTQGRRGAYLITGHRGAGKTTFVEDAIATYRRDVFRRFLRSDVGRSFFWDRLGLLGLVTAIVTGMLILKHFVWFLLLNQTAPRLPGLAAIPILVLFCNPLFIASGIIDAVFKSLVSSSPPTKDEAAAEKVGQNSPATDAASGDGAEGPETSAPALDGHAQPLPAAARGGAPPAPASSDGAPAKRVFALGVVVVGLELCVLAPIFVRPWWAHLVALLGGIAVFVSVRDVATKAAFTAKVATDLSVLAIVTAAFVAHEKGGSWTENLFVTVALLGFLVGLTSRGAREAFWPVVRHNGAAFLVVGAAVIVVSMLRTPIHPVFPVACVTLCSSLISFARAVHEALRRSDGRESVRWMRVFVVLAQIVGILVVTVEILAGALLRTMWLPVVLLALSELAVPHYFASIDSKSDGSRTEHVNAREGTDEEGSSRRVAVWASRMPFILTLVAKILGLFLITIDLISPALRWAEIRLQAVPPSVPEAPSKATLTGDVEWIIWVVLFLMAVTRLEYDWILRPAIAEGNRAGAPQGRYAALLQDAVPRTFFYSIYEAWLPVLKVNVNLGVDSLNHRRVVEVMMTALHEAYHRTFAHWRSPLSVLGTTVRFGVVLFFMTLAGNFFFSFVDADGALARGEFCQHLKADSSVRHPAVQDGPKVSHVYDWACSTRYGDDLVRAIRFNLLDPSASYRQVIKPTPEHLGHYFMPTSFFKWPDGREDQQVEFRTYHLCLVLLLYWITQLVLNRWPVLPYRHIEKRLQRVLDSLSSSIDEQATRGWGVNQLVPFGPTAERSVVKRTAPLDSRRVELTFLSVLRDIHFASIALPLTGNVRLNLPAAEIIFVFDELDKASLDRPAARDRDEGAKDGGGEDGTSPEGVRRLASLLALFADMKNILSSAPARFFFVGGRDLHDAWLADQMARQPLLTRIFDDEVYLPSLLTDGGAGVPSPHGQIERYVQAQMHRAKRLFEEWKETRQGGWLGIWREERLHATFETTSKVGEPPPVEIRERGWLAETNASEGARASRLAREQAFWTDFICFLAYRSSGNVKRLREIVEGFLQPGAGAERGADGGEREHDLVFHDEDVHRIQLLSEIYQGIARVFRGTPMVRDDKIITSLFYISNTLLKFHRQAFNLANFERIDEVVDVHRAPEIRAVIHELLEWWTGSLLRSVHNGVFTYRLRAEIAQEIRLAARMSEEEMAALHFALDESRTLKELYRARLEASETTPSAEVAAALGEIHDLDGEYDSARYYYLLATKLLDEKLQMDVRGGYHDFDSPNAFAALFEVLNAAEAGVQIAARRLPWASARLRLMLQIGLTYEHQKDYDRALVEYRNARILADVLTQATRRFSPQEGSRQSSAEADTSAQPLSSLQRLLVQPALAEVFAAEKLGLPGETPGDSLEELLDALKTTAHQGSSLMRAEVFARRGDLNFFRDPAGRDPKHSARADYFAALGEISAAPRAYRNKSLAKVLSNLSDVVLGGATVKQVFSTKSLFGVSVGVESLEKTVGLAVRGIKAKVGACADPSTVPPTTLDASHALPILAALLGPEAGAADGAARARSRSASPASPLVSAALLSIAAADLLREEGSAWDAALAQQRAADFISRVLWWGAIGRADSRVGTEVPTDLQGAKCLVKLADGAVERAFRWWRLGGQSPVLGEWSAQASHARQWSARASHSRQWTALLVTACRLRLVVERFSFPQGVCRETRKVIHDLWAVVPGHSRHDAAMQDGVPSVRTVILDALRAYSYPMLARLRMLSLWIESAPPSADASCDDVFSATEELVRIERAYRARLLFTPFEIGMPLAMLALFTPRGDDARRDRIEEVKTLARAHLLRARRQVDRRRAYYEAISDLHYLADDFNEPRIRVGHALQAAVLDLGKELSERLKREEVAR